jgi:hypothetical protein
VCASDAVLAADGLTCVRPCRDGYQFDFVNKRCEKLDDVDDSYDNSAGVTDVEYDLV